MTKEQVEILIPKNEWVSVMGELLKEVNTPQLVGMKSNTPVDMNQYLDYWIINAEGKRKKNPSPTRNPFYDAGIRNISRKYKINTGFDYEKSVNDRRTREGLDANFKAKENWFEVISKALVIDKKTMSKLYFRYQYIDDSVLETEYKFEGNAIDRMIFEQYIKEKTEYENQGVEDTCKFQVCNLENILYLSMNGSKYIQGE